MVRNCACHEGDELKVWGALIAKSKSKADMMDRNLPHCASMLGEKYE